MNRKCVTLKKIEYALPENYLCYEHPHQTRKGAVKKQPEKKNYKSIEKDRLVVIFVVKFN